MQRLFDLLLSALVFLVLSPILLPVMLVLRFTGEGEAFYLQERIGLHPLTTQTFSSYSAGTRETRKKVRPGLSGVGSIIFRNEENILSGDASFMDYYRNVISFYKCAVGEWYVVNQGIFLYFLLIFLTAWFVLFPNSSLVWKISPGLPVPSPELQPLLSRR